MPDRLRAISWSLGVLLLCMLAAVAATWPLATDLSGSSLGGRFQLSHAWAMETVHDGLTGDGGRVRMWVDPTADEAPGGVARDGLVIHTTGINYPGGGEIVFLAWFNLLLGHLLRSVLPYLTSFNLGVLLVLSLGPWSAWMLARRVGASPGAAGLAAVVFGYSPAVLGFVHNGQLAKYNHGWVALLALLTWELCTPRRWWAVPLAGLVALVLLGSSPTHFVYGGLGCALLAAWRLAALPDWRARAAATLRLGLSAALVPLVGSDLIHHFAARESSMLSPSTPGEDTALREVSAGLGQLLWPTSCPVPAHLPQTDELHVAYLGLLGLGIAGAGLVLSRERRRLLPWWSLLLVFAVLAMGRSAEVAGHTLPLPLAGLVAVMPEGRSLVFVYRAIVVASLGLAVLVALGADSLASRLRAGARRGLFFAALGVGLLVDQVAVGPAPWPMAVTRLELPPAWGTLRSMPGDFGVVAWPVDHAGLEPLGPAVMNRVQHLTQRLVLFEGWHDKGLAFVDKGNHTRDAYQTGLLQGVARLSRGEQPDARLSVARSVQWLEGQQLQYLVLHTEALPAERVQPLVDWLTEGLGPPERWEGDPVLRWRLVSAEQR